MRCPLLVSASLSSRMITWREEKADGNLSDWVSLLRQHHHSASAPGGSSSPARSFASPLLLKSYIVHPINLGTTHHHIDPTHFHSPSNGHAGSVILSEGCKSDASAMIMPSTGHGRTLSHPDQLFLVIRTRFGMSTLLARSKRTNRVDQSAMAISSPLASSFFSCLPCSLFVPNVCEL
ncbi:hypothetical protein VTK73DRAFT_8024 [Phialemonium thermophilum]|uniref:Uncharacterized protein n=1 Tax=Phialemonium thermophilum TaxID=223376 RepID=A0ABR3WBE1_9PEZI